MYVTNLRVHNPKKFGKRHIHHTVEDWTSNVRVLRSLRSLAVPSLDVSFRRTLTSANDPATWNSLPPAVINCDTLCIRI